MTSRAADRPDSAERPPNRPDPPEPAAAQLKSRHLLGIAGLDADEITLILDTAEAMKEIGGRAIKKVPTLRGRTIASGIRR